jgi:hypothetical protein
MSRTTASTSPWGSCSSQWLVATVALVLDSSRRRTRAGASDSNGKTFLTVEEALELAFPGCKIERRTEYLDEREGKRVEELASPRAGFARPCVRTVALREGSAGPAPALLRRAPRAHEEARC